MAMIRKFFALSVLCAAVMFCVSVTTVAAEKSLEIFSIDTEGGQATLIVSPSGQSMLIDTGWPGFAARDADRIAAATKLAGVTKIDYVVITHFHRDHVGGVPQLLDKIKVGMFIDHGPNMEDSDVTREDYAAYQKAIAGIAHRSVKPGDKIPFSGMDVEVLTADGKHIAKPVAGAGQPNPYCASETPWAIDTSENARSLGLLFTYGKFRFIDLGDLTKQKEVELVCPNNLVGTVDLYLTTHHGFDQSNAKSIVDALHPRVAIMNNGAKKGGSPEAWQTVHDSPGLLDLWQSHYSVEGGAAHNEPEQFIANLEGGADGNYFRVAASSDGTFSVTNSRTRETKTYKK